MKRDTLRQKAWFEYDPHFLAPEEATQLQATLTANLPWEQVTIQAKGKPVQQPRLSAWCGELPYHYSGQTLDPRPWHPDLWALCLRLRDLYEVPFNHVVLNYYRDGRDHIGFHCDNEPELGRQPVIPAISLGSTRAFVLQWKIKRSVKRRYKLAHGSLATMGGSCQHTWRHAVPTTAADAPPRINLTFRWLRGAPGWRQAPDPNAHHRHRHLDTPAADAP